MEKNAVHEDDPPQVADEFADDDRFEAFKVDFLLICVLVAIPLAVAFLVGSAFYRMPLKDQEESVRVVVSLIAAGVAWATSIEAILKIRSWKSPF